MKSEALADAGTPIYVTGFDGARVPATGYRPVWVGSLADDVTRKPRPPTGSRQRACDPGKTPLTPSAPAAGRLVGHPWRAPAQRP